MDGKHFVAIEDLAESLHLSIAYDDAQVALMFPQISSVVTKAASPQHTASTTAIAPVTPIPPVTAQPMKNGIVKGALTSNSVTPDGLEGMDLFHDFSSRKQMAMPFALMVAKSM